MDIDKKIENQRIIYKILELRKKRKAALDSLVSLDKEVKLQEKLISKEELAKINRSNNIDFSKK